MGEGVTLTRRGARRQQAVASRASSSGRGGACPEVDVRPRERLGRRRRGDQHIFDHVDDAVRREHVRQDDLHAVDLEGVHVGHLDLLKLSRATDRTSSNSNPRCRRRLPPRFSRPAGGLAGWRAKPRRLGRDWYNSKKRRVSRRPRARCGARPRPWLAARVFSRVSALCVAPPSPRPRPCRQFQPA